jgi:hypothetical protein
MVRLQAQGYESPGHQLYLLHINTAVSVKELKPL